jgi:PAS domain S-box-containing protein
MASPGRRLIRIARRLLPILAVLALLAAALFLAQDAASGSSRYGRFYPWLLGVSGMALLVVMLAIVQRLIRLSRELKAEMPGARLNRRLLLMLIALALPPVLVVYGFSLNFLNATIDTWFNVHLEQSLDDALELGRAYLDERLTLAEHGSLALAAELADAPDAQIRLDRAIESIGATELTLFDANRAVLATASSDPRFLNPAYPDANVLLRVNGGGRYAAAEPVGDTLKLRIVLPVPGDALGGQRLLQGLFPVPPKLQPLTARIESASFEFQRLKYLRDGLKLTFTLVLSFVLLLSVFFVLLVAFGVARRLVAPIGRMAAATRAVGAGRFDTPLPVASDDEIGFLLNSFNQMTRELELAGARASRSAQQTESQRAYLKAVLERLSSGVLGLDRDGVLRTVNRAAETILGAPLAGSIGQPLLMLRQSQAHLHALIDPVLRHIRDGLREWREEVVLELNDERRALLLRGAELPATDGEEAGYVVVFDDLTVLNSAQRDAAWSEVARRLAHEVKNPLTPIQLAAERLRRRFIGRLPPEETEILDRATHTIVSQVEALKSMVNSFGDYSRPPQLHARPLSLHALIGEVLDLYENDQRIKLTRNLAAADPLLRADAGRLRQLLHNLLKNALEAIGDMRKPNIEVSTLRVHDGGQEWVELAVADNGPGLPDGFGERWFEPYKTSKAKGTGLGLAVVKKIAEEHGGSVRAENRPENGAVFTLRLPIG